MAVERGAGAPRRLLYPNLEEGRAAWEVQGAAEAAMLAVLAESPERAAVAEQC